MKKWFPISLLLILSLLLTACQNNQTAPKPTEAKSVEQTVLATYFDALKGGAFEEATKCLETVPENFAYDDNEVMKHFFAKMTYTVKETKKNTEGQEATVLIKLPNTAIIYDEMMNNIGEEVQKLQGGDDSAKTKASNLMIEYLINRIDDANVVMVENTVKVTMKEIEGKWVIVPSDELSKALSGIPLEAK